MVSIRARRLADGTSRWDVNYSSSNRFTSVTFHDPTEAECFAHVVELRRRRWPLQDLVDHTDLTPPQLATLAGYRNPTAAASAATRDGLTDTQADHWAIATGHHPAEVWGWPWLAAALPPATDAAAVDEAVA